MKTREEKVKYEEKILGQLLYDYQKHKEEYQSFALPFSEFTVKKYCELMEELEELKQQLKKL